MSIPTGICPKCDKQMLHVYFEPIEAKVRFGSGSYNCLSYQCPHCKTTLSIQMDPLRVNAELLRSLKKQ